MEPTHSKWYTWPLQLLGATWSWLSDSRTLTAITVVYTLFLLYFLLRDKTPWQPVSRTILWR